MTEPAIPSASGPVVARAISSWICEPSGTTVVPDVMAPPPTMVGVTVHVSAACAPEARLSDARVARTILEIFIWFVSLRLSCSRAWRRSRPS